MWDIYPRPQLVRNSYFNLNGEWQFAEQSVATCQIPPDYNETIQVPFVAQSPASGLHRIIPETNMVSYKKTFRLPEDFIPEGYALRLNFGAVDQVCKVVFNGNEVCIHDDGYTHFSCILEKPLGNDENTLEVHVWDTLDDLLRPRGKQRHKSGGMWYTPCTGIWQTVWMEAVPKQFIEDIKIDTTLNSADIKVFVKDAVSGERVTDFTGEVRIDDRIIPIQDGQVHVDFADPKLWSPESPNLYEFIISTGEDEVSSYLGLRTLKIAKVNGTPRILLNGKPYFFHGVLDQGYFKDGIFTPLSEDGYMKDIVTMKELGFNTLRKHIKVEPDYFYYLCDTKGMIVFQDMVNNGEYKYIRDTIMPTLRMNKGKSDKNMNRDPATQKAFLKCAKATVKQLYNHPSIALWTIFNEGWGQFTGDKVCEMVRSWDSSRIIDTASGWYICQNTDVTSPHVYFWHVKLKPDPKPIVLSEYGGYVLPIDGHTWQTRQAYGYKDFKAQAEYEDALFDLMEKQVLQYIKNGLCSDIYTQLSDVEEELNGLMTYDREVVKADRARFKELGDRLQEEMKKYS